MNAWKMTERHGWGRTSGATVPTARPERMAALPQLVQQEGRMLAVGLGRSYGDNPCPVPEGRALLLHRLNRIVSFDDATGLLVAEAGLTFADILHTFLPRGWLMPVTPGTSFVTLGGAIANDVHGKNHIASGTIGAHIVWIDLLLANGQVCRVSRTEYPLIFAATLGGLGLTGVILRAALQLKRVEGNAMAVTHHRVHDIEDLFDAYARCTPDDDYDVAWIDAVASGGDLGRGIFEKAHHTNINKKHWQIPLNVPFDFPSFAMNSFGISVFNTVRYYTVAPANPALHHVAMEKFLYPLDSIHNWYRMYGKRGFHQFQAVFPEAVAFNAIKTLLGTISQSRRASFLTTIKRLGAEGEGLLSFPQPGFTLALDFPNKPGVDELLRKLIHTTRDFGGRIYLAKDSVMTADDFTSMYPRLPQFREALAAVDPTERMCSQMAVRLGLRRPQ